MKRFKVHLRDGRVAIVQAETYRHEGDQYVFDRTDTSEVQFFVDSDVTGIVEAIPATCPSQTKAIDDYDYI